MRDIFIQDKLVGYPPIVTIDGNNFIKPSKIKD